MLKWIDESNNNRKDHTFCIMINDQQELKCQEKNTLLLDQPILSVLSFSSSLSHLSQWISLSPSSVLLESRPPLSPTPTSSTSTAANHLSPPVGGLHSLAGLRFRTLVSKIIVLTKYQMQIYHLSYLLHIIHQMKRTTNPLGRPYTASKFNLKQKRNLLHFSGTLQIDYTIFDSKHDKIRMYSSHNFRRDFWEENLKQKSKLPFRDRLPLLILCQE